MLFFFLPNKIRYFGEIVRTHGPLDPTDIKITEPLSYLPEDKKDKLFEAGGIAQLLVKSGQFIMDGNCICPIEEVGLASASWNISGRKRNTGATANAWGLNTGTQQRETVDRDKAAGEGGGGGFGLHRSSPNGLVPPGSRVEHLSGIKPARQQQSEVAESGKWEVSKPKTNVKEKKKKKEKNLAAEKGCVAQHNKGAWSSGNVSKKGHVDAKVNASGEMLGGRDLFSPTSSTSSISSSGGSAADTMGQPSSASSRQNSSRPQSNSHSRSQSKSLEPRSESQSTYSASDSRQSRYSSEPKSDSDSRCAAPKAAMVSTMMQTESILSTDKWVMTEPLPPVDTYRERYENVLKEKEDLQVKLQSSEDQKYKLQKSHKRELEEVIKQSKLDTKKVFIYVGHVM